jgi:hypothetical protein
MCVVAEATRRRRVIELSIRRIDQRRITGEGALHRCDGIFGTDRSLRPEYPESRIGEFP